MTRSHSAPPLSALPILLLYLGLAWLTTRQMQSGAWLVWASVASFALVSHLVWGEYRPQSMKEVMASRPFAGFRFLSGVSGAFNFFLFGHLVWFWGDANPLIMGQERTFYILLAGLCAMYPLTIWASSWGLDKTAIQAGQ